MKSFLSKLKRIEVILGIIMVLFILLFSRQLIPLLTEEHITQFISQFGMFGPIVYGLIYYSTILLLLPEAILSVLAGLLFGRGVGFLVIIIAATAASSTAFWIGRYVGSKPLDYIAKGGKLDYWFSKLKNNLSKRPFRTILILRSLFLPYIILSYALGSLRQIQYRSFVFATFTIDVIYTFLYVWLGSTLFDGPQALILPVLIILLSLQLPRIVRWFTISGEEE